MSRNYSGNELRLRIVARLLIAALPVSIFAISVWAGDKSSKDAAARAQATALFAKALAVSDIRAPGSPPFELQGTIDVRGAGAKVANGTYLLKWAAPDKWREEIHFPNYFRIRVGGKNEYWQVRSIDYETLPVYVFSVTFDFARTLRVNLNDPDWNGKYKLHIKSKKVSDHQAQCVVRNTDSILQDDDFCFDSDQATLLLMENHPFGFGFNLVEFDDFNPFGGKIFPNLTTLLDGKRPIEEFRASQISALGPVDDSQFAPPESATLYADCPAGSSGASKILSHPELKLLPDVGDFKTGSTVATYSMIGPDGLTHNIKVLGQASQKLADSLVEMLHGMRYAPPTCTGNPLPEEQVISLNFRVYPQ